MPPDRSRSANTQGRQKSCFECAKGKRKCDLGNPSCARCSKQRLRCTYPQSLSQAKTAPADTNENNDLGISDDFQLPMNLDDIDPASFSMGFDVPPLPVAEFDIDIGISNLESLNQMLYNSPDAEDRLALERAYSGIEKSFSIAYIAPFAKSRVRWSIEQLKLVPKSIVKQGSTPWQHPMLYQEYMPRCLQDAYGACALYIAKNDDNEDFVTRFLKDRSEEVCLDERPQQPVEILSRAHALMLYQIMLVFGGDIRLYSQAERLLPCLEETGLALIGLCNEQVDTSGSVPLYPMAVARASWNAYIFRESLRRTVLCLFQLITMCNLLRGQLKSCSTHLGLGGKLTISAQLWNAKTAFDYALAWNNRRHFLVNELDFTEVLKEAMPEDIDTIGKMMMIGLQGEDDIRGWFYTRGGSL
ncbi:hypothetical protein IQ06DRAFT_143530 [Phaeosphaeriaceae sp. SRC1lsM3a]|nr:hypothetical protein IQ06DRAFT_143530 [Stagonospora sp. SRC1lsM3a]